MDSLSPTDFSPWASLDTRGNKSEQWERKPEAAALIIQMLVVALTHKDLYLSHIPQAMQNSEGGPLSTLKPKTLSFS